MNQSNHRHKVCYLYPHESMRTGYIVATDVWLSGDPSGMAVCSFDFIDSIAGIDFIDFIDFIEY